MNGHHDPVHHPAHYTAAGPQYESIKIIEAWGLGFCLGNATKYILRAAHKGSELTDLRKALWYLERWCESSEHFPSGRGPAAHEVSEAWRLSPTLARALDHLWRGLVEEAAEHVAQRVAELQESGEAS